MTINAALTGAATELKSSSTSALLDSEVILCHLLRQERSWLLAHSETKLSFGKSWLYARLIKKRSHGMPLAYIIGAKEFYGRKFKVNRHTLIPRPDTELLVETALDIIRSDSSIKTLIDIGTGSGCLAITLALAEPKIKAVACDISASAIKLAQKNSELYKIVDNITFKQGNLLDPVIKKIPSIMSESLVITNLPYLKTNEISGDLLFEPKCALDGGQDGLKYYKKLIKQIADLPSALRPKILLLELHPPTSQEVAELISAELPDSTIAVKTDLADLPRLAIIRIKS